MKVLATMYDVRSLLQQMIYDAAARRLRTCCSRGLIAVDQGQDRARQQYLYDNRSSNSNPVALPGSSNHEAGMAFDIPARFRSPGVIAILKKWGFNQISGDPPHFQWKGTPSGKARIALNARINAWYRKCILSQP